MIVASAIQLLEANRDAAQRANDEIALYAGEFSQHFMAGCFSSMLYVERSSEVAEPGLFDPSTEPSRLETRRRSPRHWMNFDLALLNEDLLARRYIRELEYEFVLVLDISRSMTNGWLEAVRDGKARAHVCFLIKYIAYALLSSALSEGFACRVVFLDQGSVLVKTAREDETFPFAVIAQIDELIAERPNPPEPLWLWDSVLRDLAVSSDQMLVAVVSDFLDPLLNHGMDESAMLGALSRLRFSKRLMALQVNNMVDIQHANPVTRSLFDMHYGESGSRRGLSDHEVVRERMRYCAWLGQENAPGLLEERMSAERVPFQKFFRSDDMNQRLETLTNGVLQT